MSEYELLCKEDMLVSSIITNYRDSDNQHDIKSNVLFNTYLKKYLKNMDMDSNHIHDK